MNIIIVEDETPALNRIKKMVFEIDSTVNVLATADSIQSAVSVISQYPNIDLALMDIELADGQSFEIFNRIQVDFPIIFTTAYDEFALKAFKVNSIDYLLKPIDKNELNHALNKFSQIQTPNRALNYQLNFSSLLEQLKPLKVSYKNRFLVKMGTKYVSTPIAEISYFNASDKVVYLHTFNKQRYIVDYTLEELIPMLDPALFFHLNRQFIINISSIAGVHSYFNGKLKIDLNPPFEEDVLVSRERASEFKTWLDK